MVFSKLTSKNQATIPAKVRIILDLKSGDHIGFEVRDDGSVIVKKVMPFDVEYAKALNSTLSEWSSQNDEEDYSDL